MNYRFLLPALFLLSGCHNLKYPACGLEHKGNTEVLTLYNGKTDYVDVGDNGSDSMITYRIFSGRHAAAISPNDSAEIARFDSLRRECRMIEK